MSVVEWVDGLEKMEKKRVVVLLTVDVAQLDPPRGGGDPGGLGIDGLDL